MAVATRITPFQPGYPTSAHTGEKFNTLVTPLNNMQGFGTATDGTFAALSVTSLTNTGSTTTTGNTITTGYELASVGNALTAVGTNRATALQLAKQINNVTTTGSGTGVLLPVGVIGMVITLYNADAANDAKVYATASETIDGTAGATGVTLTHAKRCQYTFVAANTWISAQLGVVSA